MKLIAVSQDFNELKRLDNICRRIKDVVYQQGFSDPIEALEHIQDVDIVIADTNITGGAASFAGKVHELDENINIAFISDQKKFAMDAFNVDAIDYCLKPCTKSWVLRVTKRAKEFDSAILSKFSMPDIPAPITDIGAIYNQLPHNIRLRSERIAAYVSRLIRHALDAGVYADDVDLSEESYSSIIEIVKLHDIGMSYIPPEITGTNKKDRLQLQKHTEYGMLILARYMEYAFGKPEDIAPFLVRYMDDRHRNTKGIMPADTQGPNKINLYYLATTAARSHHERWDGKGYPDGMDGELIPVIARMCAICCAYDELIEQHTLSHDLACIEIKKGSGSLFDPVLVDLCPSALKAF